MTMTIYCKCAFLDLDGTFNPGEPCEVHPKVNPKCDTCRGLGEVDETLGGRGIGLRSDAPCPDCVDPQPIQKYKLPKPRVCLCHWLGFMGFKCRAHGMGKFEERS